MNVLVLNCGSSTVKFQLIATDLDHIAQDADEHLAGGVVERIGGEAIIDFRVGVSRGARPRRCATSAPRSRRSSAG
jgi:acetate kinase